jgi:hypothetical protein
MAGIGAVSSAIGSVSAAIAARLPGSPVDTGALTVLNHDYAGKQIALMLAGGLESGKGSVTSAADSVVNPVAMAASASGGARPGGGGATVNYSPTINIGAGVSSAQKQDFMALLRSHKDEIASMLGQQSGRNDWLSYS